LSRLEPVLFTARRKRALRHGGGQQRVDIHDLEIATAAEDDEMLAVDEALEKLAGHDKPRPSWSSSSISSA